MQDFGRRTLATYEQSPTLNRLASHMDIAWDLDGTLIEHPASSMLHSFILGTPQIRHVIITFRTERRHGGPWAPLARYNRALGPKVFKKAIYMPDALWEKYAGAHPARSHGIRSVIRRVLRPTGPALDQACRSWKGLTCHQEGITALVDDLTQAVAAGCKRHGIELFHPADFLPHHGDGISLNRA